ncbi:helix-turn-helix domain-containing protein [Pseudonocardia lacus]|uniref:helix-turn-helix domain-containing protein n=1 Tax=Pseudonocardia lacus TaxID=2835865 RepID=UPI0027E3102B|nr:helix-turn-helix domain-containing protein [Pseudonocardia lacus]
MYEKTYCDRMPRSPGLLTTREAAEAIGINYKTLQRYVREGTVIPTIRLPGGQMRWDLDDLKDQLRGKPRD